MTDSDFTKLFAHKTLTRIIAEPNYESLSTMYREIKANATSIATTLGGGSHGHLGLVMSPAAYHLEAPNTPYIRPQHPGELQPPQGTQFELFEARRQHELLLKAFKDSNHLERQLIQQIIDAIDPAYTNCIKARRTGLINMTIHEVIAKLFELYGDITPQTLNDKRKEVTELTFDPSKQIDTIFNDIDDFALMAEAAGVPETASQLINLGLIILSKSGSLAQDIRTWNNIDLQDRTWPRFISHFQKAQKELRRCNPTANALGYHGAHAVFDDLVKDLKERYNIANVVSDDEEAEQIAEQQMQDHMLDVANATQEQTEIMNQMKEMMKSIQALQTQVSQQNPPQQQYQQYSPPQQAPPAAGPPAQRSRIRNPYRPRAQQATPRKYCHTHGSCAHSSNECKFPSANHQRAATFQNMMGGSKKGCYWLS